MEVNSIAFILTNGILCTAFTLYDCKKGVSFLMMIFTDVITIFIFLTLNVFAITVKIGGTLKKQVYLKSSQKTSGNLNWK